MDLSPEDPYTQYYFAKYGSPAGSAWVTREQAALMVSSGDAIPTCYVNNIVDPTWGDFNVAPDNGPGFEASDFWTGVFMDWGVQLAAPDANGTSHDDNTNEKNSILVEVKAAIATQPQAISVIASSSFYSDGGQEWTVGFLFWDGVTPLVNDMSSIAELKFWRLPQEYTPPTGPVAAFWTGFLGAIEVA